MRMLGAGNNDEKESWIVDVVVCFGLLLVGVARILFDWWGAGEGISEACA